MNIISAVGYLAKTYGWMQKFQQAAEHKDVHRCKELALIYMTDFHVPKEHKGSLIPFWLATASALFDLCLFQESLQFAELAAQEAEKLSIWDERAIQARLVRANALLNCQRERESLEAFQELWEQLKGAQTNEMVETCIHVGTLLAENYLRIGRALDGKPILLACKEFAINAKCSEELLLSLDYSLATNCLGLGRYDEGCKYCESVLDGVKTLLMEGSHLHYGTLMTYSLLERKRGQHVKAYQLAYQALRLAGEDHNLPEYSSYLVNVLATCQMIGKWNDYMKVFVEGIDWLKKHGLPEDSLVICQFEMNGALALAHGKQMDEADQYAQSVKKKARNIPDEEWNTNSGWLKIRCQMGYVDFMNQNFQQAEEVLNPLIPVLKRVLGEYHPDALQAWQTVVMCKIHTGRAMEALEEAKRIRQIRRETDPHNVTVNLGAVQLIIESAAALGRLEEAFRQGLQFFRELGDDAYQIFEIFDERAWYSYTYQFHQILHKMIGWAVEEMGRGTPQSWFGEKELAELYALVLQYKNILYDQEWVWKANMYGEGHYEALKDYYDLLARKQQVTDTDQLLRFVREETVAQETVQEGKRHTVCAPMTYAVLQQELGEQTAAVDVVHYLKNEEEQGYAAFMTTCGGLQLCDWGSKQDVDRMVEHHMRLLTSYGETNQTVQRAIKMMRMFFELSDESGNIFHPKKLILALDGHMLPRVPWHVIFPESDVQVLPTYTPLPRLTVRETSEEIVAFCAPEMENGTEAQRKALRVTKPCLCALQRSGQQVRSYCGTLATPEALKAVASPEVLHIAAHGDFAEDQSEYQRSCILLSRGRSRTESDADFHLTDAMQMDLRGTRLVVLESCYSDTGYYRENEGVFGFVRAFFIAGAQHVLTALWAASSLYSCIFMDLFYRGYFSFKEPHEAYRQAQQRARNMDKQDIMKWMETIKPEIQLLEDGETILQDLLEQLEQLPPNGKCFDKPVYWACYVLHSREQNI